MLMMVSSFIKLNIYYYIWLLVEFSVYFVYIGYVGDDDTRSKYVPPYALPFFCIRSTCNVFLHILNHTTTVYLQAALTSEHFVELSLTTD